MVLIDVSISQTTGGIDCKAIESISDLTSNSPDEVDIAVDTEANTVKRVGCICFGVDIADVGNSADDQIVYLVVVANMDACLLYTSPSPRD